MINYRYINQENAKFLLGLSPPALHVLENGLKVWDKQTGIPTRIIKHSKRSSEPPTFSSAVAGIVAEEGKGMRFVVAPDGGEGRAPMFQTWPIASPAGWQEVSEVPLRYLLKGFPSVSTGYTVYLHSIIRHDDSAKLYYGITSRHWFERLQEHRRSANSGSPYLFHRALREDLGSAKRFQHSIIAAGITKEQAYDVEEYLIDKYSLAPNFVDGLNMIPGGFEGTRQLVKQGLLNEETDIEPEETEALLEAFARQHPRAGVANPLISARWEDDAYAEAVICGRENRLQADQVRLIRMLAALGNGVPQITTEVGANGEDQVKRVLQGRTYSRIK